jgi:AraC-like DNA-binding protein
MVPAAIRNVTQLLTMARHSGFSARALSKALKISPRQFRRHTHDLFGCSPQAWLNQQRLRLAPDLLKQQRCIKIVAFNLGFKLVSHFSREFKLHYGLCPTSFIDREDHQTLPRPREDLGPTHPQAGIPVLLDPSLCPAVTVWPRQITNGRAR